jgi:hypothetical protein
MVVVPARTVAGAAQDQLVLNSLHCSNVFRIKRVLNETEARTLRMCPTTARRDPSSEPEASYLARL